jgi:hypothetical protein
VRAYYAHCVALYGTRQEERDLATLAALGLEVLNPNTPETQARCDEVRAEANAAGVGDPGAAVMETFREMVLGCDALAFRALPDGSIPAGVGLELSWAIEAGKPVIELPSCVTRRTISVQATREYIRENGNR